MQSKRSCLSMSPLLLCTTYVHQGKHLRETRNKFCLFVSCIFGTDHCTTCIFVHTQLCRRQPCIFEVFVIVKCLLSLYPKYCNEHTAKQTMHNSCYICHVCHLLVTKREKDRQNVSTFVIRVTYFCEQLW